jgi:putative ABC transport system substrate-binding protein
MNRRSVLLALLALGVMPTESKAQTSKRVPRVGILVTANPEPFNSIFLEGLRRLGYVDGQNIKVEYRSADGKPAALAGMAAELVNMKVDLIVVNQTQAAHAAKAATNTIPIPIVMTAGDPVGTGLISSLGRPGGNITGLSSTGTDLAGKLLELIREVLPTTARVAVLANAADPFTKPMVQQIEVAGTALQIAVSTFVVTGPGEFDTAFSEMARLRVHALVVQPSLPRGPVLKMVAAHRLPSISISPAFVTEGGLLSYSANQEDLWPRMAVYADKILKGAKPADLPVEQPTKFVIAVNLKTAKALGLTIPQTLLLRADRVIE